ncbi:MASE1 domain-containing protein [Streptomyces sp. NPDC052012]|uniref:MASE1 domain-containing protein n=1 Tax=Streptomyces sp. NPDC052012 TaxID=3155051 RepID=UPI00344D5A48
MACVVARQDLRAPVVFALWTLGVAACYFAAGRLGLLRELVVEGAVVTPIWPPTGVALAALLILGLRSSLGIALGALFVVMSITTPQPQSLVVVAGNTAAPVCGYLLLRRQRFRTDLARLRDGLSLVFLGAFAAMLISSTTGAVLLLAEGKLPADSFWTVWLAWWVGDAMGVLIVTPLLLLFHRIHTPVRWSRWKEAAVLTVITAGLVPLATHTSASLLFIVYPLLIWAALRFQLAGSMVCALFASVMATIAATDRTGPFAELTRTEVMINLLAFNGAAALTALLLSSMISEQRNLRRSVERACQELVEVLEHLTAGEGASNRAPPEEEGRRRGEDV